MGTVGAVALDARGRLAAATSTGGMTGKRFGRIGDSPLIGAGTYADDRAARYRRPVMARCSSGPRSRTISARACASAGGRSPEPCSEVVMEELPAIGGEGGVIAIDRSGRVEMEFNSEGMFRASRVSGGSARIDIYRAGAP